MLALTEIHSILKKLGASPLKRLSQNFLISRHWVDKISDAIASDEEGEEIWEIGPGLGSITETLVKKTTKPITLFEFDKSYVKHLSEKYPTLKIVEGDILKARLNDHFKDKKITLLSNLPYHISSQIMFLILENKEHFSKVVFTFQKEFADRLLAKPSTKEYGALSILIPSYFEIKKLGDISKNDFFPAPSVDSTVLAFKTLENPLDYNSLKLVTQTAFSQRRKKMSSNLKKEFQKEKITSAFESLKISDNARAEELTKEQFWSITKLLTSFLLFFSLSLNALQDQTFGLGGSSSARVGSVAASKDNTFSSLYNPALLSQASQTQFQITSYYSSLFIDPIQNVLIDSEKFKTQEGLNTQGNANNLQANAFLWSLGFQMPFELFAQKAGFGFVLSGPFDRIRSFKSNSPYDFSLLRYGNAEQQFKGTMGLGLEIIPEMLSIGVSSSLFITGAGSAEADLISSNPVGRWNHDVGFNTTFNAGLFFQQNHFRAGLAFRQEISPRFDYDFTGKVEVLNGTRTLNQPFSLSTYLYFEPQIWDLDFEYDFEGYLFSVGTSFQRWSGYEPSFLMVSSVNSANEPISTKVSKVHLNDTLNPKVSISKPLYQEDYLFSVGYQFRPTPLGSQNSEFNFVDASTHAFGLGLTKKLYIVEFIASPLWVSLFGQFHFLANSTVTKNDASYIGSPGYSVSGRGYSLGLSLQTKL
jgi:16S rRNA (adenine1518-N6/adenine1519-N6)-dimethyltransferase